MDGAVQVYRRQENGIWYARFSVKGRQLKKSLKTTDLTKAEKEARLKIAEEETSKTEVNDQTKYLIDQKIDVLRSIN